jgi:Flp pilus assembly protein TadD
VLEGKIRDPKATIQILSRRRFLRSSAGLVAASWAAGGRGLWWAEAGDPPPSPVLASDLPDQAKRGPKAWTPVSQALARFSTHRFACERHFQAISRPLEALRSALLAAGAGIGECLSPRFRSVSLAPERETVLRDDSCFVVRRAEWADKEQMRPALGRDEFAADLRRWLQKHAPLALAQLDCTEIREGSAPTASAPSKNLVARFRFQLSGASGNAGVSMMSPLTRWQMSGEWEIEWEMEGTSAGLARTEWRIVGWRPLEAVTVLAPELVFTDVTRPAFGQDPSYATHLLRDTNYWRAVLDEASGIDIFGNYGISVGDADGDGRDEIYVCQPQGLPNRLYRQTKPGIFEDIAPQAGVDLLDATAMALFADLLNRGRQDLILITQSAPLLFLNDGHGKFTLARNGFPPSSQKAALTAAALGDYDRDGFLDLYVCSYGYFQGQGAVPLPTPYYDAQNGPGNHLYRNRGDGTFVDVTTASGLDRGNNRYSFSCIWADIDDDGWPDLCVVNDFGRNNLYHNRHDGTFEEIIDGLPGYGAGMSAAFADVDGDGLGEVYAAGMWQPVGERVTADPDFQQRFADVGVGPVRNFAMGSNLYHTAPATERHTGAEQHQEAVSPKVGPKMEAVPDAAGARWAFWNWCSDIFDLDNDGWPDIYCLNGYLSSPTPDLAPLDAYFWEEIIALSPHAMTPSIEYRAAWAAAFDRAHRGHAWDGFERNSFFLNSGAGRFVDASAATGLNFIDDGRSFAVFDYDGDGDADLIIRNRTGPQLRLLRNEIGHRNQSLAIRLTATQGNRDAIGARVEVETPEGRRVRYLSCGSGFLAQHSKELVFGLGDCKSRRPKEPAAAGATGIKVRVRWPSGNVIEYADLAAGNRYHLLEGRPNPRVEPLATPGSSDAASGPVDPPLPEPVPARFSTALVDPLPTPSPAAMRLFDEPAGQGASAPPQPARIHGSHRYALLWLWDADVARASRPLSGERPAPAGHGQDARATAGETPALQAPGLDALLAVQGKIPSRLVIWGNGPIPPRAAQGLDYPACRANGRFRLFCSTLLAYLFDYRRDLAFPTGLLFEVGPEAAHDPAALESFRKLVKVYWGGAEAEEILEDARRGVKSGAGALPFSGRTLLCSFRRDFRWLGAALVEAGCPEAAETYLAQLVENNPHDPEAQYNLALLRSEAGNEALALSGARAALAARPVFPEAENLLAVLLMRSGQLADARSQLEKTTQQAPDFAEAWNNLGYVLLQQGELPSARQALERALALVPDFSDAMDNLGIVMARQRDVAKAGELFRRALELQPENEQAANNLGVLYAQQGRTQEALETFRSLLRHNPEASSALYNLAKLEISLGNASEAKSLLESWLARHPGDANARKLLERAAVGSRQ